MEQPDQKIEESRRERLDILLMERGLAKSRSAAVVLIERGSVRVNGVKVDKASRTVLINAKIEVVEPLAFVGRAGEKLEQALSLWKISVQGLVAADIGASTGGFTDCLLKRGVKKVYAIDVGTGQLNRGLLSDPRVVNIEQTDVRQARLPEPVDIVTIDVSFISLTYVLADANKLLKDGGLMIVLVKPQFEVGPGNLNKHGVVTDESKRKTALEKVRSAAKEIGLTFQAETVSTLVGSAGNIEYLLWLKKPIIG